MDVLCCRNLSRVFSLNIAYFTFVGNEGIYIVWVKGKKVTLKILKAESFAGTSRGGTSRETDSLVWFFSFQHVLLKCSFYRNLYLRVSCELVMKLHWFFISCSILHQLNTKPNTIKSHKIQRTKLKQIQHFLSWNKTNINHSCKSQL